MILREKDTICAVSTPAGVGGVAIIRVSGADAISISDSVLSLSKPLAEKKANTVSFGKLVRRQLGVRSEELGISVQTSGESSLLGLSRRVDDRQGIMQPEITSEASN